MISIYYNMEIRGEFLSNLLIKTVLRWRLISLCAVLNNSFPWDYLRVLFPVQKVFFVLSFENGTKTNNQTNKTRMNCTF